jgi:hypothetical protein
VTSSSDRTTPGDPSLPTTPGEARTGRPAPLAAAPGEALPASRRLERPPSDRYAAAAGPPVAERPRLGRSGLLAASAAAGVALVSALSHAILSITSGLLAAAVLGGWLIGLAARVGAWGTGSHVPDGRPRLLATVAALGAWLGGLLVAWLVSMAILPGSTRPFPERLAGTPFLDWVGPQLGPLEVVGLGLIVVIAGLTAGGGAVRADDRTAS